MRKRSSIVTGRPDGGLQYPYLRNPTSQVDENWSVGLPLAEDDNATRGTLFNCNGRLTLLKIIPMNRKWTGFPIEVIPGKPDVVVRSFRAIPTGHSSSPRWPSRLRREICSARSLGMDLAHLLVFRLFGSCTILWHALAGCTVEMDSAGITRMCHCSGQEFAIYLLIYLVITVG